jgi:hypothetical protein
VMQYFAGAGRVTKSEIKQIYDYAEGDRLYQSFQDNGYINGYGDVQDKLQQLNSLNNLELPAEFDNKRSRIYELLNTHRYRLPFPKVIYIFLSVILWIVNILMGIGFIKSYIMLSRDEEPDINELFKNWRVFIPYLVCALCYGLVVLCGLILLIVPGIILMVAFHFAFYLIIDKDLGPIAALKRSRVITKGSKRRLMVLGLLLMLLNIAGFVCLIIGLFFTLSISSIAMARIYDILENEQV